MGERGPSHSPEKKGNGRFFWCSGVTFGYEGQKPLFKNLDFGIDMDSRSELVSGGAGMWCRSIGESRDLCDPLSCYLQSVSWALMAWGKAPCSCC